MDRIAILKIAMIDSMGLVPYSKVHGASFSILGVATYSQVAGSSIKSSYTPELGIGAGLLVEGRLYKHLSLDIGTFYVSRALANTIAGVTSVDDLQYLQISLQIRFGVGNVLSFGIGEYYAVGVGSISRAVNETTILQT